MTRTPTTLAWGLLIAWGCSGGSATDPDGDAGMDTTPADTVADDAPPDVADATPDTTSDPPQDTATDPPADTDADSPDGPVAPTRWVSGYYVGYQRDLYPPAEVDFTSLTHLMVGRIEPRADGSLATHFDIDDVAGPAMARDLAGRAHDAGVVPVLMVGGAGVYTWADASSDTNRAAFVANLLAVMDDLGFDGLDLDWEPIATEDQPLLRALAEDLRAASPGIVLTIPLGWVNANFPDVDAFYADVAPLFDQVNLMTYSMAGAWGGWQSWHSSALAGETASTPSSVSSSIDAYLAAGVPAAKLGIGIGFYGECWSSVTGPGQDGPVYEAGDNAMSYTNIMASYFDATAREYDDAASVPYLSFSTPTGPEGCTFVSYDDPESIAAKGAYVREAHLGGAIIWTINQGYIATNPAGSRNPPLEAARDSILLVP